VKKDQLKNILENGFVFMEKYDNGDEANKYIFNEKLPEYKQLKTACWEVKMKVDDYHYKWFAYAFQAIADNADWGEDMGTDAEMIEAIENIEFETEADIYTSDLTKWLHSDVDRVWYLTDAIIEFKPEDGFALLSIAQDTEIREVYDMARNAVIKLIERL
jgi:hypothetical protein